MGFPLEIKKIQKMGVAVADRPTVPTVRPPPFLSATALARLACKGVPLPLAFWLWLWFLVVFFDFGLLGGPGFHPPPSARLDTPQPRTLLKPSKFNIFGPQTNKNQYFLVSNL